MVSLIWPWFVYVALALVVLTAIAAFIMHRSRKKSEVLLANTGYVHSLGSYRRLMVEYVALRISAVLVLLVALFGTTFLVAREATSSQYSPQMATRDIVICLDVSGSMRESDIGIVQQYTQLSDQFTGERVSLVLFDATSSIIFPLTDDYALIKQQLGEASVILSIDPDSATGDKKALYDDYMAGTSPYSVNGTSLIGDGLASCAFVFDHADKKRSRSIVLATDNDLNGEPLYSLPEAMNEVGKNDITLYAMYATSFWSDRQAKDEYQREVDRIGGKFYVVDQGASAQDIITDIQKQDADLLGAKPITSFKEFPMKWFIFALIGLVGIVLIGWRLES